ncbi:MAG: OsmC family protein [Nevskiales bacterium]|nr:OsmC family protein [Nevskiales bacterium]
MHARIKWLGNAAFAGETDSGHTVTMDGPPDIGGQNRGPRPMELMLLSVGSCSAVDVVHILKKARQPVTDVQVEVQGTRAETDPKVFTAIHLHFIVSGQALSATHVERAVTLSAEKYCSASIMLGRGGTTMTHDFEMRESGKS